MKILVVILIGIIILASIPGNFRSNIEEPEYKLITSEENIEIDVYSLMILAEKLKQIGQTFLAFHNPPSGILVLRQNEVMIEVDSTIDSKFVETHR